MRSCVGVIDIMNALYVFWTAPYLARGVDLSLTEVLPWFERYFLALSAGLWQQHSGRAVLVTDSPGAAFIERCGLAGLWSDIETATLDSAPADIDASVFWDIGKTLAVASCDLPVALLDLDLVAWSPLRPTEATHFFHWEAIETPWYPAREELPTAPGYQFPEADWSTRPGNTALLYLSDPAFRDRFVHESLCYARGNKVNHADGLAAFLFSGQRLFTLIGGSGVRAASPYIPYVFSTGTASWWINHHPSPCTNPLSPRNFEDGASVTHLWGYKHQLRENEAELRRYCTALLAHARTRNPQLVDQLRTLFTARVPECTSFLASGG
jgi:hypothetical protein